MKLLYIANLRLPTEKAYGINIAETCGAFADFGSEVALIFPYRKNEIGTDFFDYYGVKRNFKSKIIPSIDFYLPGGLDKISVVVKNFISGIILVLYSLSMGVDVIYSRDELPLFLLSFFKKNICFEAHKFSDSRRFYYRRFLKRKIRIVAISESIRADFLNIGFSADNVIVAHDGVNLKDFDIQISKEEARKKTGLPQDAKIAMYTGHLFDWKGANVLLEAARNFQFPISNFQKRTDLLFVFIGGTEYDIKKFKEKALGLNNVLILGHQPHKDIPIFLKAADVLVLPNSAKDRMYLGTSPIKLFEYMASGRPIVASNLSSISEILNKDNALLVSPDDPAGLVEDIKVAMDSEDVKERISKKAFENVQNYTWQKRAEKILNFIK